MFTHYRIRSVMLGLGVVVVISQTMAHTGASGIVKERMDAMSMLGDHAKRNLFGGVPDRQLTGNNRGPEGASVPAITADTLRDWTIEDLAFFLEIGMTPEGDFAGGHMAAVIEQGTAHLSSADRLAMATYLKSPANGGFE